LQTCERTHVTNFIEMLLNVESPIQIYSAYYKYGTLKLHNENKR